MLPARPDGIDRLSWKSEGTTAVVQYTHECTSDYNVVYKNESKRLEVEEKKDHVLDTSGRSGDGSVGGRDVSLHGQARRMHNSKGRSRRTIHRSSSAVLQTAHSLC